MNSRLSSLLVRDGVLGVKRMEQAFQRQVIYGGSLDSILLEMGAVPEERLWHYLSLATALPSADRDLLEYFDPRAVQVCPRDTAERFHVAPCALDGAALRVLVTDPVDLSELESLATTLGVPVQPFVVPEYRFHLQLERLFGIPTPSRYSALSRKCGFVPQARPAEPTVVVDDGADRSPNEPRDTDVMAAVPDPDAVESPVPAPLPARTTQAISTDALHAALAEEEARRRAAELAHGAAVTTGAAAATGAGAQEVGVRPAQARGTIPIRPVTAREEEDVSVPDKVIADPALLTPPAGMPAAPARDSGGVVKAPWRGGGTLDPTALEPAEAAKLLASAEDRDSIFALLVRAVRSRARYSALLTVQGGTAFGRIGIDGYQVDGDIAQVAVPLASAAALRGPFDSGSPYIGPVRTSLPEIDQMLEMMGGVIPPTALVLPLVIRDRTVALVYAHRGADTLSISEVADALPVATDAAMALQRLIVKAKSSGFKAAAEAQSRVPTATALATDELPAKGGATAGRDGGAGGGWGRASTDQRSTVPASGPDFGATAQIPAQAPPANAWTGQPIGALLDAIEAGEEPGASRAAEEALARVDELVPAMAQRFPGRLVVDRYSVGGRALRAGQHGPLLALALRAGQRVVPMLVEKLSSADREVRYYATLALAEVRAPIAVTGLVGRVFDSDYGVRGAALEALMGYPPSDVDAALEPVRRALRSDSLRARAAAYALGELRDVKAILDLIDATERDATTAAEAHRALVQITKQDFGTKAKKWRKWWEEHKGLSRIEWMIAGLGHGDQHVRASSIDELMRLTGESFNYHPDAPKREREESRQKWSAWWAESGRRRFLRDGAGSGGR